MNETWWTVTRYVLSAALAGFTAAQFLYPHATWIAIPIAVIGVLGVNAVPIAPKIYSAVTGGRAAPPGQPGQGGVTS